MLAVEAPSSIGERFPHPLFAVRGRDRYALLQALRALPHAASVFPFGDELHYADARADVAPAAVADELRRRLRGSSFPDAEVTPIRPGIEDTFMALMGAPPEVAA